MFGRTNIGRVQDNKLTALIRSVSCVGDISWTPLPIASILSNNSKHTDNDALAVTTTNITTSESPNTVMDG